MTHAVVQFPPKLQSVVDEVRCGRSTGQIAAKLGIKRRTVCVYVERIAARLPNPDGLRPYLLVFEWSRR